MRIAFQIEHLDPARGGAETYVATFAAQLLAAGHEVHIVAGGFAETLADTLDTLARHPLANYNPQTAAAACAGLGADVTVAVGYQSLGFDVFQPHGGTFAANRRQNLALIRNPLHRGLMALAHRLVPKHRRTAALEARQYAQRDPAPHFVAISKMVRADMQRDYAVPDDRCHLVYNGVDTDAFDPQHAGQHRALTRAAWGLAPDTTCFLLMAHNFRLKGLRELIEATDRIRRHDRDFRVVVVGRGRPDWYRRLAAKFGCDELFHFVGATANAAAAHAAADVYVHPTWYDPCSLVVLEALASGRPVITTRFNGAGELLTNEREGYVIDRPDNTEALAWAMVALLDGDRRSRMGRAARTLAESHTLERNFAAMTAVLELAAAQAPRRERQT